jgi:hypothetical protein
VKENGKVEQWSFQAYSPVTLRRNGTDRQVFLDNIDKDVWIRGCLSKTGKANAAAAGHVEVLGRRDAAGRSDPGLRR